MKETQIPNSKFVWFLELGSWNFLKEVVCEEED
jgi:hypothetical protein